MEWREAAVNALLLDFLSRLLQSPEALFKFRNQEEKGAGLEQVLLRYGSSFLLFFSFFQLLRFFNFSANRAGRNNSVELF